MKKQEKIYHGISQIDAALIEEAGQYRAKPGKKKRSWKKWAVAAACLGLGIGAAAIGTRPVGEEQQIKEPLLSEAERNPIGSSDLPVNPDIPDISDTERILRTSDTYDSLPELLAYLSENDYHDQTEGFGGGSDILAERGAREETEFGIVENTGVAVSADGGYSYHIAENAVQISRLDGENTEHVGAIAVSADGIFCYQDTLVLISQRYEGDELDREGTVIISFYDITDPRKPVLREEYRQRGELAACFMDGARVYVATGDGVCACGWSRLADTDGYYPALARDGEDIAWGEDEIAILGEPTRVQYMAVTVLDVPDGGLLGKSAWYGDIRQLFYGKDWVAVTAAAETLSLCENPVVYTFDGALSFTGKISTAEMLGIPEKNVMKDGVRQDGAYAGIVSITNRDGIYRMAGGYSVRDGRQEKGYFLAAAADVRTGKTNVALCPAEDYPHGAYDEILWEDDRMIACVGIIKTPFAAYMQTEVRFLFAEFEGLNVSFHENALTADMLHERVGSGVGNPLGQYDTLIPLGEGTYLRYVMGERGPGGFDVFDFTDSGAPRLRHQADGALCGENAYDYLWYVYDSHTFGTLKVILGEESYCRDVGLAWCVYRVDPDSDTPAELIGELALDEGVRFFSGADDLGFAVFEADGRLYYVTRDRTEASELR